MRISFLGLGKMGTPIARLLLKSGEDVTVWNRTASHADALGREGARVAQTPAEAVAGCDVVFTMVMDDAALEAVLHEGGVLARMAKGSIHVSLSTVSVALSRKLTEEHARRGQHWIAAPVFGRPHIAEAGKLWLAVAGEREAVERVRPLLERFSRGITVVAETPWSAHALKLGGNFLITAMIASLSESFLYAEMMGVKPEVFLETVNSALFQSPFYQMYGSIMLHPPEKPGGTMALGEKDTRLFCEAAHAAGVSTPLGDLFLATLRRAIEAGMSHQDWAAGYLQLQSASGRLPDAGSQRLR
ncbi:MAG TPA: NAD(P)-dependent oxidoreductase [Acidobacteriaceae bacterium]|nr:NAD(P)-dependent oxidoreductase [Acidobacteriaceae bacterium]